MKLEALYKKIKEQSRDRCRKLVLNRLVHILGKIGLVCKPYGSFATQVSLPDSDLDISVDSSVLSFFSFQYLTHRNQVILALQYIANTLKMYPWLKDFKLLDRAKVPLLTFVHFCLIRTLMRVSILSWVQRKKPNFESTARKQIQRKLQCKSILLFNLLLTHPNSLIVECNRPNL